MSTAVGRYRVLKLLGASTKRVSKLLYMHFSTAVFQRALTPFFRNNYTGYGYPGGKCTPEECCRINAYKVAWMPIFFFSYINTYISKGLQCALSATTIVALWRPLHLGYRMCTYTLWGRIALWSHQSAQTASGERCKVPIVSPTQSQIHIYVN